MENVPEDKLKTKIVEMMPLENIKSPYIIKKVFSSLNENRTFEILKYNKKYQNLFSLNIEFYKILSGRYKKDGINGPGQEFSLDTHNLIFEGDYLNGKRSGKGKEYTDRGSKLIFEGEYLNGKRNGQGKEYYDNGHLKFNGEYLNGERNGQGKEYYDNGDLKFEGEYQKGDKWNGKGYKINSFNRHILYELKNGTGKILEYYDDGHLKFNGEYLNGKKMEKEKNIFILMVH